MLSKTATSLTAEIPEQPPLSLSSNGMFLLDSSATLARSPRMASTLPKPSSFSSVIEHEDISISSSDSHHHRFHFLRSISFCLFFLIFFITISLTITIYLHHNLAPLLPSIQIHHINTTLTALIPIFDGDGDAIVSATADLVILVLNAKAGAKLRYDESRVLVSAGGDELTFEEAVVPGFRQAGRSLRVVRVRAVVTETHLVAELVKEMQMGVMVMDVEWRVTLDIAAGGNVYKRMPLAVFCEGIRQADYVAENRNKCKLKFYGRIPFN